MKTTKPWALLFSLMTTMASWTRAEVPTGAFTGTTGGRPVLAFLKTATIAGSPETFGILMVGGVGDGLFGSDNALPGMLFKIEDRGDGTAAWLPIDQSPRGLLRTADYRVAFTMSYSNSTKFQLAQQQGELSFAIAEGQLALEETSRWEWLDSPKEEISVNGGLSEDIRFSPKDRILVGARRQAGVTERFEFKVQEFFPGLWTARKALANSTAMSGKVLEPTLFGVVVWLYYKGKAVFGNSEYQLRVLPIGVESPCPQATHCFVQ